MPRNPFASAIYQFVPSWVSTWGGFGGYPPENIVKLENIYTAPLDTVLREIRTVTILPSANRNAEIECQLNLRCLTEAGANDTDRMPYSALSYVWGDKTDPKTIRVNGQLVSVTNNLFVALVHLRKDSERLEIWIDALCINQNDVEERNAQVQIMGEIYRQAACVLMWLGPATENSSLAFELFEEISSRTESEGDSLDVILSSYNYDKHWRAFTPLLNRPYWSRLWIVQEVILNQNGVLCCGNLTHGWSIMAVIVSIMRRKPCTEFMSDCYIALSTLEQSPVWLLVAAQQLYRKKSLSLTDALVLCRNQKATDPRDHVYGLFGLVDHPGLEADYGRSLLMVYREVVKYSVTHLQSLDVLCACKPLQHDIQIQTRQELDHKHRRHGEHVLEGGSSLPLGNEIPPSWVPDWRMPQITGIYLTGNPIPEALWYRASGDTLSDVYFPSEIQYVMVSGVFFDTLHAILPEYHKDVTGPRLKRSWSAWCDGAHPKGIYGNPKAQQDAFLQTIVTGRTPDGGRGTCHFSVKTLNRVYNIGLPYEEVEFGDKAWLALDAEGPLAQIGHLSDIQRCFAFTTTTQGYMGMMPKGARPGDIIVVLLGARVPFLLRKHEGEDKYFLVGECYIHGIMDGEVMAEVDEKKRQIQKFCLL